MILIGVIVYLLIGFILEWKDGTHPFYYYGYRVDGKLWWIMSILTWPLRLFYL